MSCSARAHHQVYFIQTHFVNVSSLTIITAQHINHPLFILVLIMDQHPWQTLLAYNLTESSTEQSTQIHSYKKKNFIWYLTKYLDNMLFVCLKDHRFSNHVSERNGSRFSVLVIRKPLQTVLGSRTRTALAVDVFVRHTCCSARVHHQFSLHSSSLSVLFE